MNLLPWNWSKKCTFAGVCLYAVMKVYFYAVEKLLCPQDILILSCVVSMVIGAFGISYFKAQGKIDERKADK